MNSWPSWRNAFCRIALPRSRYCWRCWVRTKRRMRARALPVTTKRSQVGDGVCALRGDDLDLVAVRELRAQRHEAAVDLGADAGVADLGMDGIGEVDRRRAARQRDQIALGREAEHLVLEHLELGVLEEFLRVGRVLEDVEQLAQPAVLPAVGARARPACSPSARRRRARPPRASRGCGSAPRCAAAPARSRRCGASGSCWAWASRCNP